MTKTKNKQIKRAYYHYNNYTTYENIWYAYEQPSSKKEKAWEDCKALCKEYNGENLRVIGKNTYHFSAGFTCIIDNKYCFVYITPTKNSYYEIGD